MGTLHFSLGDDFGALLHQIAYEHLTIDFNFNKALACFKDSGAPESEIKDLLKNEHLIKVDEDHVTCNIISREDIKDVSIYPPVLNLDFAKRYINDSLPMMIDAYRNIRTHYSKICNYNLTLSVKDLDYLYDAGLTNRIDGSSFHAYMTLSIDDVMNIWNENKEKLIELMMDDESCIRTYNTMLSDIFNDLGYLNRNIDRNTALINTVINLCQMFGWKTNSTFVDFVNLNKALSYILVMTKERKYNDLKIFFDTDWLAKEINEIVDDKTTPITDVKNKVISANEVIKLVDKYVEQHEEIKPVDINVYYDAGFISPDGLVYAMRGQTHELIHIQLADALAEIYDNITDGFYGKDHEIMAQGWIKFHHDELYYFPKYNNLGFSRKPSKRQLDKIDQYALKHWDGKISINNNFVNVKDEKLYDKSQDEIDKIFDL